MSYIDDAKLDLANKRIDDLINQLNERDLELEELKKPTMKEPRCPMSHYHYNKMVDIYKNKGIHINEILACLIDHALEQGLPVEYDLTTELVYQKSYVEEKTKLLDFVKKSKRYLTLPLLMACRHDIGIESKGLMLTVINICINEGSLDI